ncbi:protease-associated domain-containing protein 1-like [Sycon ciliatum]|uniref:protease-associated domain-containing protein 1-like n=1 Tax=Sycon ciliatum TaxID=27933 RepID=UPI0020AAA53B|eukprot:scpid94020/ scgid18620/ Protease-associated domain-containing protein 1; Protease-associated domain-containing protein of 21 kDa
MYVAGKSSSCCHTPAGSGRRTIFTTPLWWTAVSCILLCLFGQLPGCWSDDDEVPLPLPDPVFFKVVRPSKLAYIYKALPARDFGSTFGHYPRPTYLVPGEPRKMCTPSEFVEAHHNMDGATVLVERGDCSFLTKALVAQEMGAAAILIYDLDADNFSQFVDMVDDKTGRGDDVTIPVAFIVGTDGYHFSNAFVEDALLEQIDIVMPLNITSEPNFMGKWPPWALY